MFTLHGVYADDAPDLDDLTILGLAKQVYNVMINTADWQGMEPICLVQWPH